MKDFKIYTRDPLTGQISLKPPFPPKLVSGMDKLVQIVILAVLNTSGRSALFPDDGGGLADLANSNISSNDQSELFAEITERLEKVQSEIFKHQNELEGEPASERLRDLILLNVESGVNIDEVVIKFKVVSESGNEDTLVV